MIIDNTFLLRRVFRMFAQRKYTTAEVSWGEAALVKEIYSGASAAHALRRGKEATRNAYLTAHGLQRSR